MDSGERHLPSTLRSAQWIQRSKPLLFVAGLLPLARWVHLGIQDGLGANPIEFLTRSSGTWALVCLLVTLSITPLWRLLGMPALLRWRRMCSLFAFFYASLHFLAWVGWDRGFSFPDMVSDVIQRPFIAVGLAAFVLMTVLVITSTHAAMRALGRHWQQVHYAVYLIAILAVLHFWWHKAGKQDFEQPIIYALIVAFLLGWRVSAW